MSQIHYLPLTPGFFAILVFIFVIVLTNRPDLPRTYPISSGAPSR
jgi:hypothetical protein